MLVYEADTVSVLPMVRGGGELGQEVSLFPFPVYRQRHSKEKTVFKGVSLRVVFLHRATSIFCFFEE